jgi:multidrug resistance efflux pump
MLAVAIIGGAIFGVTYWRDQTLYVSTDNAQVAGDMIEVGTVNTGRVGSVAVDIGSTVHQGDAVATIVLPSTLAVTAGGTPRLGFQGAENNDDVVTSPVNGVVVERLANPGDTVAAGQAIVTVVDPTKLWVLAEIDENKVDRVQVGQAVDVHADALGRTLPGRVLAVDRASAASFSPLPQGNASGNFTKVTQNVPVKIAVDYGNARLPLGSSVEIKIHVQ